GNTASEVGKTINNPDWIELIYSTDGSFENRYSSSDSMNSDTKAEIRIYGIGACDLFHVMSYFDTPGQTLVYDCNYYKGDERAVNVATEDIRASFDMTDDEKIFCREHFYNYTGEDCFSGKILQNKYDYVVMSFHDDMALQIFTSRDDPNLRVVRTDDTRIAETNLICNGVFMSRKDQLKWLEDHFYPGEYISEERFYDNLTWIRKQLPIETKLILITSPELDFYRKRFPHVPEVRNQIIRLNHVIRRICAEYPENTGLVELNDIIISTDDITDYIYHFTAQKAWEIYGGIVETMRKFGYNASGCGQEPCLGNTRCQLSYNPSGEDWGDDIDIGIRRQYQVSDNPVWINQTWDDFNIYAKDRQIIVFGAGVGLAFYLSENESIRSLRIVDNDADKIGTPASLYLSLKGSDIESLMKHPAIRGVTVENPSILTSIEQADAVILIANLRYYDDIQMQVEKLGKWRVYSLMQMEARQRGAVHD
nr:hypothetical protein [Lachnospiraceae bacterium]